MKTAFHSLVLMLLMLACTVISCSDNKNQYTLNCVESLIETSPDSAMTLLSSIDGKVGADCPLSAEKN